MTDNVLASETPELGGLEIITLNRDGYRKNPVNTEMILNQVAQFISKHYIKDDALSFEEFKDELQERRNKNYTIDAAVDPKTKEIVAVVAHDVVDVPRAITPQGLPPGQNQYTSIYYAIAKGGSKSKPSEKYEPVLQMLIEHALQSDQKYSVAHGKTNVGLITIDSRHKRVLRAMAKKYGGGYSPVKVGVPTLRDDVVGPDYPNNFEEIHKEKPVIIPAKPWSRRKLIHVMGSDLDQSYNHLKPNEEGYIPLTTAKYFKDFAAATRELPGKNVAFRPI